MTVMTAQRRRKIGKTYRYLQAHRYGRWALAAVWGGLGLCSIMALAYVPILLERREVLRAAGATWVK